MRSLSDQCLHCCGVFFFSVFYPHTSTHTHSAPWRAGETQLWRCKRPGLRLEDKDQHLSPQNKRFVPPENTENTEETSKYIITWGGGTRTRRRFISRALLLPSLSTSPGGQRASPRPPLEEPVPNVAVLQAGEGFLWQQTESEALRAPLLPGRHLTAPPPQRLPR